MPPSKMCMQRSESLCLPVILAWAYFYQQNVQDMTGYDFRVVFLPELPGRSVGGGYVGEH